MDGNEKIFTENQVYDLVSKSVTRALYDAIATHEAYGLNSIPVGWLRDYADDIAVNFPRIKPDEKEINNEEI